MTHPTPEEARAEAWATAQVQAAIGVLLPETNSDWFEDHSEAFRERLARMSRNHLDEALRHRRFAHFMRRGGHAGAFKQWIHDAISEVKMAKHYARRPV